MKHKVTITLDQNLIPRAKALARRRGMSLSALIERTLGEQADRHDVPFSERWRGRLRAVERTDARTVALRRKYL